MTATSTAPNLNDDRVALYNPIEAGMADLVEKYKEGPPTDLTIKENYESCRVAIAEMRGIRIKAEKLRKELKADALAYGRLVDSTAKGIIDRVLEIEAPYAEAKKEHDTRIEIEKREMALAEERRVDGIHSKIATISALPSAHISSASADISALFPELDNDLNTVTEWAMEFSDKAKVAVVEAQQKLQDLYTMKIQQEQFAAEKAKAEKEAAEREEAARIKREEEAEAERIRLEKEREELEKERAFIQAERDRMAAEQAEKDRIAAEAQAEKDRIAKEEQDRLAAEQAERDRIVREEQEEKDRQAADERARLEAEIEALKRLEAEIEALKKVNDHETEAQESPAPQPTQKPTPDTVKAARNAAGMAIMKITKNKDMAQAILDAIVNGDIPYITFTGA